MTVCSVLHEGAYRPIRLKMYMPKSVKTYRVAQKSKLQTSVHIFAKYSPIFKIFSPAYFVENL